MLTHLEIGYDPFVPALRQGVEDGVPVGDIHTVTLYMNPMRQVPYYDYIVNNLNPKRIIFNPGTENPELIRLANEKGIETEIACTLVMLSVGNY